MNEQCVGSIILLSITYGNHLAQGSQGGAADAERGGRGRAPLTH